MKVFVVTEQGVDGVYGVCLKEADAEEMCAADSNLEYSEETVNTGGEPVFLLRGKDQFTPTAVGAYEQALRRNGHTGQADEAELALSEIEDWQDNNTELVQVPDHKHVPVTGQVS